MSGGQFNNIDYVSFLNKIADPELPNGQTTSLITDSSTTESQAITALASIGDPGIFTITGHGFTDGELVQLVGTDVVPALNGIHVVNVIDDDTFDIGREITAIGTVTGTVETAAVHTLVGHGFVDGQTVDIANSTAASGDGTGLVVTVIDADNFTAGLFTTGSGTTADVTSAFGSVTEPRCVTYYCAECPDILNISIGTPGIITTSTPHNLVTGDRIYITTSGTTPSLNGHRFVTVTSATQFNVGIDTTASPIPATGAFCAEKYAIKTVNIDSWDEVTGDPTYLGNELINHRYNMAESRFEHILVEDSAATVTSEKAHMIGYSDNVSKTTHSFLNPVEEPFNFAAAADQIQAISTSTLDDSGSTGANTILVTGLLAGHVEQPTETITMDGTTITTEGGAGSTAEYLRINEVKVGTMGSLADTGLSNAGIITVTSAATGTGSHLATIPINYGSAPLGMYSVSSLKTWCLSSINIYTEQKREFDIRIMVRENSPAAGPYVLHHVIAMGTQSIISGTETEFRIPAQSDVFVTAMQKSGQSDGELTVQLIGKLLTNN